MSPSKRQRQRVAVESLLKWLGSGISQEERSHLEERVRIGKCPTATDFDCTMCVEVVRLEEQMTGRWERLNATKRARLY